MSEHTETPPYTLQQGVMGLRMLVMAIPELRSAALDIVDGDMERIWLVPAACSLLLLAPAGVKLEPTAAALHENAGFVVAMTVMHMKLNPEKFYKALPGFIALMRSITPEAT